MSGSRVVIIGSGLGGLECGYILAKHGFDVTILEKNRQAGGCLQTFRRGGCTFDTGFHYAGGLRRGEAMGTLLDYFGLRDLPWVPMDEDCTDEVVIGRDRFRLASGRDRFVETLAADFPSRADELASYADTLLETACKHGAAMELFGKSARSFLEYSIGDPLLRSVVSGASMRVSGDPAALSFHEYAHINASFLQSAWRLKGGGKLIADKLVSSIEAHGGRVLRGAKASLIECSGGAACRVITADGRSFRADTVISDLHPASTLSLIGEGIRPVYRKRMESLPNGPGTFTLNLTLKQGALPYLGHNIHVHTTAEAVWSEPATVPCTVMASCYVPENGNFADRLDLMCRVPAGTFTQRNGDYVLRKEQLAARCLELAKQAIPGLGNCVSEQFSSTPLTWQDWTGTPGGSSYGILKDCRNPLYSVTGPQTPLRNLFLTGQNIGLHGLLGVSMGSIATCSHILGTDILKNL